MAVVVVAIVIFLVENLREKRSVALTKWSGVACFKNSCSTPVENCCSAVYCVASIFWILCFVFSHPIMSMIRPSVSPASGEIKKRKAIILKNRVWHKNNYLINVSYYLLFQ